MNNKIIAMVVCAFLMCNQAMAQKSECPGPLASEAEDVAATLKDWATTYDAFIKYQPCDDGAIAEGFTQSITKMLAVEWESIEVLQRLSLRNGKFLNFVYGHVTESADPQNLRAIVSNMKSKRCGKSSQRICQAIGKRAQLALKQL